jgi:hypothetical protein
VLNAESRAKGQPAYGKQIDPYGRDRPPRTQMIVLSACVFRAADQAGGTVRFLVASAGAPQLRRMKGGYPPPESR